MSQTPSSWRGQRFIRETRSGTPLGLPGSGKSGWRVLREALFWLAVIVLGAYAIFAPVLPEGGAL